MAMVEDLTKTFVQNPSDVYKSLGFLMQNVVVLEGSTCVVWCLSSPFI